MLSWWQYLYALVSNPFAMLYTFYLSIPPTKTASILHTMHCSMTPRKRLNSIWNVGPNSTQQEVKKYSMSTTTGMLPESMPS